jgi:hypothetical protein
VQFCRDHNKSEEFWINDLLEIGTQLQFDSGALAEVQQENHGETTAKKNRVLIAGFVPSHLLKRQEGELLS